MSNLLEGLKALINKPILGLPWLRQLPRLGDTDIQLLVSPKSWNWAVPSLGSIPAEQFEICDDLPQDCQAATYSPGSGSFFENYRLFIDVLSDQFQPASLLAKAKEVVKEPGSDGNSVVGFPKGWTKVMDVNGVLQWQPAWSVKPTPFEWKQELQQTSAKQPFLIPISGTPVKLFFNSGTNESVEIPDTHIERLEFKADAWKEISFHMGDWYDSGVVAGAKVQSGPFVAGYSLPNFFGQSQGLLSCRVSGMIVALNPTVTLVSSQPSQLPKADVLQNLQRVDLDGMSFGDVTPTLDENSHTLNLSMGASPDVPLIIAVVLEKTYNEPSAHSLSLFKNVDKMNTITLAQAKAIILAAFNRFRNGNDQNGVFQNNGIPINVQVVNQRWNCGPVPWVNYQLNQHDIPRLIEWWEILLQLDGNPHVLPIRNGAINLLLAEGGLSFNFHLGVRQAVQHGLIDTPSGNNLNISSEGKTTIVAKGKYRIGINGKYVSSTQDVRKPLASNSHDGSLETAVEEGHSVSPIEAFPEYMLEKIENKNKELREAVNVHAEGLVVEEVKLWPGNSIKISFKGGTPDLHRKIASAASEWTKHGYLKLDFGEDTNTGTFRTWVPNDRSDIRIGFEAPGYWSLVGTDSIDPAIAAPGEITMNFQDFDTVLPRDWAGTVMHEFGHALGFHHEHQSPNATCDFDWQKVYQVLAGSPNFWDKSTVDRNLRQLHEHDGLVASQYDINSVMHYHFSSWMFESGASSPCYTPKNVVLSDTDKQMMAEAYPADLAAQSLISERRVKGLESILQKASLSKAVENHIKMLCYNYAQPYHQH